jgi:hypothetical protein
MQRRPSETMSLPMVETPGDPAEDAFGRIVENAIRNGRLSTAEIRELRTLLTTAFGLDPLDTAPRDVDWRGPTMH